MFFSLRPFLHWRKLWEGIGVWLRMGIVPHMNVSKRRWAGVKSGAQNDRTRATDSQRFSVTLDDQLSPYQHHMKVRNVVCVSVTTWFLLNIPMWLHLRWSDEPKPCLLLYWQLLISPISHFSNMSFCCWSAGLHVTPSTEGCRDVSNKPNPTLSGVDTFKVTPIKWIHY